MIQITLIVEKLKNNRQTELFKFLNEVFHFCSLFNNYFLVIFNYVFHKKQSGLVMGVVYDSIFHTVARFQICIDSASTFRKIHNNIDGRS